MASTGAENVLNCIRKLRAAWRAGHVAVTQSCNMDCAFCTYHSRAETHEDPSEILSQIQSLARVSTSVILTGGEPTISPHFFKYLRAAAQSGFREIIVESNGLMFSYPEFAKKFAGSPATALKCTVASHDPEIADAVTRVPGALKLALQGLKHFEQFSRKQTLSLLVPLLHENIETLDRTVAFFCSELEHIENVELVLPDAPAPGTPGIPINKLENSLCRLADLMDDATPEIVFAYCQFPAPCLFDNLESLSRLFRLGPVEQELAGCFVKPGDCSRCLIDSFCPGLHPYYATEEGLLNPDRVKPKTAGCMLAPLPQNRGSGQKHQTCVFSTTGSQTGDDFVDEALLRINYNCNERCVFCWIEPGLEQVSHEEILDCIQKIGERKVDTVAITGGEPALHPRLAEYVGLIRNTGARHICLQTNATLLGEPGRAAGLARAGLGLAMVSLHSHDPDVSDMLTGAAGGFQKTRHGIECLAAEGVFVVLSHVINAFNYRDLPRFVLFVHERVSHAPIVFSLAAPIYGAMMHRGVIPGFAQVREPLTRALDLCMEHGIAFSGLSAMCGIPPCVLGGRAGYYPDSRKIAPQENEDMIKADSCARCACDAYCFGVRKNYAEIYGLEELQPVEEWDPVLPGLDMRTREFYNAVISLNTR